MQQHMRRKLTGFLSITGCLLLLPLLAGCDFLGGNSSSSATPTPKPTVATLTTYQGDGYSLSYPQGWSVKGNGNLVTFSEALTASSFIVEQVPDPNGAVSPAVALDQGVNTLQGQGNNFKKVDAPATVTLNGETWNQRALTSDSTHNGQKVNNKFYMLSNNHPQNTLNTKTYLLIYSALTPIFDQVYQQSFQPMLQSFKFAAA